MPGRDVHWPVGSVIGAVSVSRADARSAEEWLTEVIWGALGGLLGAALPDMLEPADTPRHRGGAHSVLAGLTAIWINQQARRLRGQWLEEAETCRHMARQYPSWSAETRYWRDREARLRSASGFVAGVSPGYLSHLLLDSQTPAGIPLVGTSTGYRPVKARRRAGGITAGCR